MPVTVALVGADQAGKTTLFNALTRGRGHDGVGMVDVPDRRLWALSEAVHPKKTTPAQVRLEDAPPGSRAQRIAAAREADVLVTVARCFGPAADPVGEVQSLQVDFVLTDLATVEKRLEVVGKELRVGRKERAEEAETLERARAHLDAGRPLLTLELEPAQREHLAPIFAVSQKPAVLVANVGDDQLPDGGPEVARLREIAAEHQAPLVVVCAQLESELAELEPDEAAEMRESYGLAEGGLDAVAAAVWAAGGLITYFTAGEPEARAWPCAKNSPAPVAAGVIHSDFERHFIRAEVTSVDELVAAGSMEALRAAGRLRVEGRDYRVQDGDVVFFRIGR
ncbi:MAG: redox-regulated ATPase YchF [Candidatus Dormibacteraeota bacterium]|nr:redox-regulated ATPase YchF [Candidatus Dormibacteraeota bacterium]MBO0746057.1 redox-regulated ATPase YchF [Candidatus Dormibacteraeota bacterium]